MEESFGKGFSNNLTHIVSGMVELLVLGSWRDCAHTDTDMSLSIMHKLSAKISSIAHFLPLYVVSSWFDCPQVITLVS